MTEHGAGGFGEEPFDEIEPGPVLGGEHELKASLGSRRKPRLGLLRNVRGVIIEDHLDRGHRGVGGIQHIEEFDEFATAMAVLDEGVHLAAQQVDAGEFIEFLTMLEAAYPAATAIKIILDNHSAHVSKETKAWLAARPEGRFQFVFTPKHGSWLNLVEGFFAKAARSVLRHIRSKHELKQRIMEFIQDLNRDPVIHRWHYQLDSAS